MARAKYIPGVPETERRASELDREREAAFLRRDGLGVGVPLAVGEDELYVHRQRRVPGERSVNHDRAAS